MFIRMLLNILGNTSESIKWYVMSDGDPASMQLWDSCCRMVSNLVT